MTRPIGRNAAGGRRRFFGSTLLGMFGGASFASGRAAGQDRPEERSSRTRLAPPGAPAADAGYSPGILAEGRRLVVVSGQGPEDYDADMETQIRQTFDRIGRVLGEAGASFADVVVLRSYFVDIARDLPVYRKVRPDYLIEPYPASTAVGVPALAIPGLLVEIEAMAVI